MSLFFVCSQKLLGSGAFSRVESQRSVAIEVAEDPNAYLGLDACPESANQSYTNIDDKGHLEIDMTPDNPTDAGGLGVNSNSWTWFDSVFEFCNQECVRLEPAGAQAPVRFCRDGF